MGQEKYEVWFAGIRGLGARKKYLLHEALKSCRNAYYIEETQLKKFPFLTEKDCQEIRQAQKRKDPEKICEELNSVSCTHTTLQFSNVERAGFSNLHYETCS